MFASEYECMCVYVYVCICVSLCCVLFFFWVLSRPDRWFTKLEKRNVRRNRGGVVILTCKSFDILGERGERQTEPFHRWFLPAFPSGKLEPNSVCRFKNASVCTFRTSPCMPAARAHVEKHVHTEAF